MKRQLWVLALFLILVLCAADAHAVAIGVNRASMTFDEVLRGGFAREVLTVTTDSPDYVGGEVLVAGEAAEWLNFSATNFSFSRDDPYELAVDIQPPTDAQIRDYDINFSILTGELSRTEGGQLGTATRASLGIRTKLKMTGNERAECTVGGVRVLDAEQGQPLEVQLSIINKGNVRLNPDVSIIVQDKFRQETVEEDTRGFGMTILPTLTRKNSVFYQLDLETAQHWAIIDVPECNYHGLQTFDMLGVGEIKADGEFIRIDSESRVQVGEIVPIYAIFRNKGQGSLRAQFKGTITNTGTDEIVKVINTDQYIVNPGLTAEIETFFNPQVNGRYEIVGKVFYNDKLTRERSFILNVGGDPILSGISTSTIIWIFVFIIIILLLLILIRRRKKKQERHGHHAHRRNF